MQAVFRNRFLRLALLIAAMVTGYFLGRQRGMGQAEALVGQEEHARWLQTKKARTSLEQASLKNLPPETRKAMRLNNLKLGKVSLSVDQQSNFYIDGVDLSILARIDPEQGLALLAKLPNGAMAGDAYRTFFSQWLAAHPDDPAAIAAAALALPAGPNKTNALSGFAQSWARTAPKDALEWAAGLGGAEAGAFKDTLMAVTLENPRLAAEYVGKFPLADTRNDLILAIAQKWGNGDWARKQKDDTMAALDWLNEVATGATYDKAVERIFWSYGYTDPVTGTQLLDKLTDPQDRSTAIDHLSIDWAVGHPADSMNWLQTLPETDAVARDKALAAAFAYWTKKDPAAARDYIAGIADQALYAKLAPTLAPALARDNPQAALDWVNGFADGPAKTQAVSGVLATMAQTNFDGAWGYAAAMAPGPGREGAMGGLISTLSTSDPKRAVGLLEQLDSDAALTHAVNTIAFNWAQSDPAGLTGWINKQPPGVGRDIMIWQYVNIQAAKDPTASLALANTTAQDNTRTAEVKMIVLQLAKTNLPAATQAANTANLPDAERQNLLLLLSQASGK